MQVFIVGAGGMGRVHARSWIQIPDVRLTFYDHQIDRASALASEFGGISATSFEAGLESADAVDVCTPTPHHFDPAIKAIEAGKPVLCEKPIVRTLDRGLELQKAVHERKVLFMPGHVVRFFPNYRRAHDLIASGEIGSPSALTLYRGGKGPSGSHNWFQDDELSGGVLLDLAVHDFDWLLWTVGPVQELTSRAVGTKAGGGKDFALTTLKFVSGAIAVVESSWMDPSGFRTWFDLAGSGGLIQHDSRQEASLSHTGAGQTTWENPRAAGQDPYYLQCKAFHDAVKGEAELPVGIDDGVAAVKVALAAIQSAKDCKTVKLAD